TYTSGSTGVPNGVVTTHRAAVSFTVQASRLEGLGPGTRIPLIASFGFDASVLEVFLALANGGAMVRVPEEERLAPDEFVDRLVRHEATTCFVTPAMLATLPEPRLRALRYLYVGGDAVPAELPPRWAPGRRFFNAYGPTETTVLAVTGLYEGEAGAPPIGRPLGGMRAYAVDRELRQVPAGVPGELVIGGPGLARGYLDRPGLTAARFIPDPFGEPGAPGGRLYRTGDLVRQLPDGRFGFLGRLDGQVKVRGIRIETGEVEATLASHPAVHEAVVIARDDPEGKRLVAYVVRREEVGEEAGTATETHRLVPRLRQFLRERLPGYMVPSAFVTLDALPITTHGKVDRAALPAPPPPDSAHAGGDYHAPRDPVEADLAGIWAELLGAERVGILDSFFDLGGHSLLATQVVSRMRDRFGAELPVRVLFEEPTVAGLADYVRRAAAKSPATDAGTTSTPAPPLVPVPRDGSLLDDGSLLPLSFAQERLWFLDRLVPNLAVYNMPFSLRLPGPLPLPVLAASLSEVVRRHEALRTRFVVFAEHPVQVIDPPSEVHLPVVDLAGLPEGPREDEARRQVAEEAARRFDLEADPMLRAGLLRLAPDDHILLLTLHHIASDGWSMGVLAREIETLLPAFAAGQPLPLPLPPLPVQYADYTVWQRRWLSGAELERQIGYWRERLAGVPAVLSLPLDRPRPPVRSFQGARRGMALPLPLLNDLAALAGRSKVSLFMVLLAVWKTLLARITGESDLVVGTPIANRHRQEVEGLIGFFVNMLVLRTDLDGDPSFLEIVERVRETALSAYAHQDLPFERLVEELAPERSLGYNPLFQVQFILDETSPLASSGPGAGAEPEANQIARFDLTLAVQRGPYSGGVSVGYNTDLFRGDTAERLLGYLQRLLEGVVAEPARCLSELPLLSAAERHQLLRDWNDTERDLGAGALLHELFERWAAETPDAAAIVFDDATVTYGELDRRAGRLAARLAEMGVGTDDTVGVLLPRSVELFTAILAVLKAGGAWVPLDPSHPEERRDLMLRDSGARVLISSDGLSSVRGGEELVPSREVFGSLDRLAYVIYTSGSTGTPNGVMVPHRAAVDRLREAREMFAVGPESRLAQVLSPGFDASVMEVFLAFAHGASLCIVSDAERLTPHALAATLERQGATVAVLTPAVLSLWPEERLTGLRALSVGGEPFPAELAARWARGRRVLNVYGPTEATIFASYQRARPDESEAPSIGRPAANTRVHLLDRALRPVPLGVAGEIAIGGVGIARGYLGRPDRTAERFIPDPWSGTPGARLYRSGDLARLLPDGRIEFLGRIDQQVKMRGYRIEPGEIEAALRLHPSVRDAAVLVREGRTGDPGLVSYVVLAEGTDAAVLRPFLEERLPVYMVPSAFVTLDALPVTPNGKVDRAALPALSPEGAMRAGGEYRAPRDPVEAELAKVWAELLGAERVGILDNFFDLGGHSLLATQVVSRVRDRFGAELLVSVLFEEPTLAGFANRVRRAAERPLSPATDAGTPTPPLVPVPRDGSPLPLSFAQERLWFLDRLVPGMAIYNMPLSLRLPGSLPLAVLAASLSEVVRRHEALRTRFAVVAERPVQVIDPPSEVRLPVADLAGLPEGPREDEARRLVAAEAARRFDLEAGPMLRAGLLRLAPDDHVLLLTLHHIASDGWSMGVLEREIEALLPAFTAGRPSPLPPLPIQYADYAVWQRRWLSGAELERQLGYWRGQLAGAPAVLPLPLDRPRPPVRSFQGARRGMTLPLSLLDDLAVLAGRSRGSLFMVLLAVWKALLARVSGESDLVVGTPIANRHRQEVEGLIGFFVNTLVLRTGLDGDPSFLEIVARVRETALGAYAHQDLPFERLVEEQAPERSLRHNPLFQVLFTLDETSPVAGAGAGPVDAANQIVRFDLTLAVQRGPYGGGAFIGYNTDLFRDDTTERLLGSLERLLAAVVAEPERRLSELPLLSEAERHQLLLGWNDTARDLGPSALLHELFERWAAETPDAVAAVFDDLAVTYGELDRRAGRLAARLAELGVGADDKVGLLLPRSIGLAVAILAVLKAGGAWVPLDPSHPEERRDLMLCDAGARVLVTEEMVEVVGEGLVPSREGAPEALAYVIYTSGSTGTPNGVMVTHRNAVDRLRAAREMFAVSPESRVAQVLSPGFDASVMEFFLALAHGACLCFVPDEERLTPHALAATLERHGATVAVLTPAVLSLWPEERLAVLRALSVGGEPFPAALAAHWAPGRRVLNVYGPTETTIFASSERVHGDGAPPIGRPAANTRIHVLDRALHPVPVGVAGEVAVGGVGVARGYLGRPDRTAERFIPDPWSQGPGARLYRSGDLARLLPDGRIDFLGRIDDQVKVRGFRIEPGEVEAALRLHSSVMDAAVLARDKELVGYVVLAEGADPASLRPFLEERLPVYMVPPHLVPLPALPVTPNGKVDRRALARMPLPGEGRAGRGRTEPDGAVERFVADLFKEVLRLDAVGMEESFFELGGTSLQAAILINLLQERLGEYVYVVALFDAPSTAELAVYLEREYPAAAARLRGETAALSEEEAGPVTPEMLAELRRIVLPLPSGPGGPRNRRAVFILSPPRSGSTLLRVLLAGHPDLFAPPELELLGFNTLGERRDAFSGRYAFWREGAVRAWMEVRGIPADEAFREIEKREDAGLPVRRFYREMQELIGDRLLIDKTPSYALDPATLARAEEDFEEPLYIYLLRHPYGMVASFEKAHLEQVFFRYPHPFPSRRLAELIWTVSHQNIQEHLEKVPPGRRHFVRFEDLVRDPRGTLERLCAFLGIELDSAMLDPYEDKRRKMTDGVHELSRMMGDVRFHEHRRIDPEAAESWRSMYEEDFLGEPTREMADSLGYETQPSEPAPRPAVLVPL
ncbi:MAG TPA: amino acid adenylation domain-containing protein, partial [Thermoanaerobaculia bacterium]|nr:amino acid adenylation domain-containing protein [Thermoanaerobaculia bacterium]